MAAHEIDARSILRCARGRLIKKVSSLFYTHMSLYAVHADSTKYVAATKTGGE